MRWQGPGWSTNGCRAFIVWDILVLLQRNSVNGSLIGVIHNIFLFKYSTHIFIKLFSKTNHTGAFGLEYHQSRDS